MAGIWGGHASGASRGGTLAALGRLGRGALNALADAALPPTCLITDRPVTATGRVSATAWAQLTFITDPCCASCGAPFAFDAGADAQCGPCLARAPAFSAARAALAYDEASRPMILAFKHGGRVDGLAAFAGWMAAAGQALIADADIVTPTPLHPRRLRARRFNQASVLAAALAARAERAYDADVLERVKATPSQGGLSARARRRNVAGAFRVRPPARERVEGARVILVDDVMTTGATANACARALKRVGAARVDVVTLARVVRAEDVPR